MSEVIDFPIVEHEITESEVDNLHSEAFRDLESSLCDCAVMGQIAAQCMSNAKCEDGMLGLFRFSTEQNAPKPEGGVLRQMAR
jgi:hypothetical protein